MVMILRFSGSQSSQKILATNRITFSGPNILVGAWTAQKRFWRAWKRFLKCSMLTPTGALSRTLASEIRKPATSIVDKIHSPLLVNTKKVSRIDVRFCAAMSRVAKAC